MEDGEHQAITIEESNSNIEMSVRSTNEIEESNSNIEMSVRSTNEIEESDNDIEMSVRSTNEIEESDSDIETSDRSTDEIDESNVDACANLIQRRLEENRREGTQSTTEKDSISIYRVPQNLSRNSDRAVKPDMVSIGPYHHHNREVLEFQSYKWRFLDSLLSRIEQPQCSLLSMTRAMKKSECKARRRYSEPVHMSSDDFTQMMLLDGCFIIELFQRVCGGEHSANANDLVFMPRIPILIGDLLKLENQLPLFVLLKLYRRSIRNTSDPLVLQALKFFNLALPRSTESLKELLVRNEFEEKNHLLDLLHSSYRPQKISSLDSSFTRRSSGSLMYRPSSDQSIPCVTRLWLAGVNFRRKKCSHGNFLDINFHKGVLEIPPITINDITSIILFNFAALEQCYLRLSSTYVSEYIVFMGSLSNSPRDVAFLCDNRIITNLSHSDQHVANLFKKLGENVVLDISHRYLPNELTELAYYSNHWATLRRTYFSSPWSTISVVSASALLALTAIQTITAILSYKVHHS